MLYFLAYTVYRLYKCIQQSFVRLTHDNQAVRQLLFYSANWFFSNLKIHLKDEKASDRSFHRMNQFMWLQNNLSFFFLMDLFFAFIKKNLPKKTEKVKLISDFSKKQQNIHNDKYTLGGKFSFTNTKQTLLYGVFSIWNHIRFWVLPLTVVYLYVQYTFFLKSLPFSKVLFGYFLLINMFYLLISGFVFFFKKYQYRLYTSSIQRFWRRTLVIFWLIEASLFVVFIYLTLNASQEPIHVYDNVQIYKTHFYSWRYFLVRIITSTFLVVFTYLLLLGVKWNTFSKSNNVVFSITVLLLYVAWLEFYQFFHLMNYYGMADWFYDFSEHLWNLDLELRRTRIVNHYVTICLIAKFWHVIFSLIFWIFFVLRGLESSRYRYPLLVSNLQNFLIIYMMSWLYMYPWFKFVFRKVLDVPYYWFFFNNRKLGFFLFFNDMKLYYWGLVDYISESVLIKTFFKKNLFYYWYETSFGAGQHNNTQFRKHNIRDFFLRSIR